MGDRYTAIRNAPTVGQVSHSMIVIKAVCADEIRRIPILNQDLTFEELCFMMHRLFKDKLSKNVENLVLKYTDPDGDLVTLTETLDVSHALDGCKVLRVSVFDKETLPVNRHHLNNLTSGQVKDLRSTLIEMRNQIEKMMDIYCKETVTVVNHQETKTTHSAPKETIKDSKPTLTTSDITELIGDARNRQPTSTPLTTYPSLQSGSSLGIAGSHTVNSVSYPSTSQIQPQMQQQHQQQPQTQIQPQIQQQIQPQMQQQMQPQMQQQMQPQMQQQMQQQPQQQHIQHLPQQQQPQQPQQPQHFSQIQLQQQQQLQMQQQQQQLQMQQQQYYQNVPYPQGQVGNRPGNQF